MIEFNNEPRGLLARKLFLLSFLVFTLTSCELRHQKIEKSIVHPRQLSEMWDAHSSQSPYEPPSEIPLPISHEEYSRLEDINPGFFSRPPRNLPVFAEYFEFSRALPNSYTRPTIIASEDAADVIYAVQGKIHFCCNAGGPTLYVEALICARDDTVLVIKEAVKILLSEYKFEITFPSWTDIGFLYAHKVTQGEVFTDGPRKYEEIKLVIKLDYSIKKPIAALSVIYEINAGPRISDLTNWNDMSDRKSAINYVDNIRWKMRNIIQSAFDMYCKTVKAHSSYSPEKALELLRKELTKEQMTAVESQIMIKKK